MCGSEGVEGGRDIYSEKNGNERESMEGTKKRQRKQSFYQKKKKKYAFSLVQWVALVIRRSKRWRDSASYDGKDPNLVYFYFSFTFIFSFD